MAPKKKQQKMALADFFADTTSGSWADEMDLPTAPAPRDPSAPKRGEPGYLDSMPDRSSRPSAFPGAPQQREELPLPTAPPFTAFIGNLSFDDDVDEKVREFFQDLQPTSVRIVKDPVGKPKGFGYAEFPSQDTLRQALDRSGSQVQGRTIRVNVAEASSSRRDLPSSAADETNQWRRTTPLPARADAAPTPRRGPSFSPAEPGSDRDWGVARGARFTPAPPVQDRERSFPPRVRDLPPPSHSDDFDQWRSNKPLVEAKQAPGRDAPPHQRPAGPAEGQSSPSLAETEQTWSRGTKLRTPAPAPEPQSASATNSPGEERDWRSAKATPAASRQGSVDGESPRQAPAPLERRRLQLAPRSTPATPSSTSTPTVGSDDTPTSTRSNIFGSAKPIDSATKEQAAAEKLAAKDEERKKAREAEIAKRKEEDDKARAFADERQAAIKAATDKAAAEAGAGAGSTPAAGAGAGSRGPQHQARPQGGNQRQHSGSGHAGRERVHPSRKASDGPAGPGGARSPPPPAASGKDEEGFEAVTRGGKSASQQQQAADKPKRDASTRPQFSFAAAAKADGFVEEASEEDGKDKDVNDVTNGVAEVKV